MLNRKKFFDGIRGSLFKSLKPAVVAGIDAILDEWDKRRLGDLRWLAYMLATAYHETAYTMRPIAEYGKGKGRKYGVKGMHGQVAYGRGYVQLTWDYNYARADLELRLNGRLINDYDLAMDPEIAAAIMFEGMIEGWFTTKKLGDYFTATKTDWSNARRIINGTDKAATIASYARTFYKALQAASADKASEAPPVVLEPVSEAPAGPEGPSGLARIIQFIINLFRRLP